MSTKVALLAADVVCLGLRKRRQPKMRWRLRGSKACLVPYGEAVSHGSISGISCRCILEMSYGETESTLGGVVEGASLGWLEGGVTNRVGMGYLVGG